jgi:hypothetical protein
VDFVAFGGEDIYFRLGTLACRKDDVPFDRIIIILDAVIEPLDVSVVFVQCEAPVSVNHCQYTL